MPTRQYQGDFITGSQLLSNTSLTRRPDAISFDILTSFTYGPINQGDTSGGELNRAWRIRVQGNNVKVSRANDGNTVWEAEQLLFAYTGAAIEEIDCAFDQSGRVFVCAQRPTGAGGASQVWLYWFDPFLGSFTFQNFGNGRNPRCLLDNPLDSTDSDVLVFYFRDDTPGLFYRQQRDRYAVQYATPIVTSTDLFLEDVVKTTDNRIAVVMSVHDTIAGTYSLDRLESSLYPFISEPDKEKFTLALQSGTLANVVLVFVPDHEDIKAGLDLQSGSLISPVILHTVFDIDEYQTALTFQSGTLLVIVIEHTVFDIDQYQASMDLQSGVLLLVVIEHTVFDPDQYQCGLALQGGTLAIP